MKCAFIFQNTFIVGRATDNKSHHLNNDQYNSPLKDNICYSHNYKSEKPIQYSSMMQNPFLTQRTLGGKKQIPEISPFNNNMVYLTLKDKLL